MYYNDYYDNTYTNTGSDAGIAFLIVFVCLLALSFFGALSYNEARRQNRNAGCWFILGFLFTINAFIALKVSKAACDEAHSQTLWSVLGLFFGIAAIFAFESGLNAENKGHDFDCWVITGFCFGLISVFISCFLKPFEKIKRSTPAHQQVAPTSNTKTWICPNCGTTNIDSKLFCSNCSSIKPKD